MQKGRWELGEHDLTFGWCEPTPCSSPPPPPGPVAARADCRIQQGRKNQGSSEKIRLQGRGRGGERLASATATILRKSPMQATWTCPNNNVSPHPRHTHAHTVPSRPKHHAPQDAWKGFQFQEWTGGVGRTADGGLGVATLAVLGQLEHGSHEPAPSLSIVGPPGWLIDCT
jgi:hypothetical protein